MWCCSSWRPGRSRLRVPDRACRVGGRQHVFVDRAVTGSRSLVVFVRFPFDWFLSVGTACLWLERRFCFCFVCRSAPASSCQRGIGEGEQWCWWGRRVVFLSFFSVAVIPSRIVCGAGGEQPARTAVVFHASLHIDDAITVVCVRAPTLLQPHQTIRRFFKQAKSVLTSRRVSARVAMQRDSSGDRARARHIDRPHTTSERREQREGERRERARGFYCVRNSFLPYVCGYLVVPRPPCAATTETAGKRPSTLFFVVVMCLHDRQLASARHAELFK